MTAIVATLREVSRPIIVIMSPDEWYQKYRVSTSASPGTPR